jgi:uncharacterized membrane protein YebE (DUF533 family)
MHAGPADAVQQCGPARPPPSQRFTQETSMFDPERLLGQMLGGSLGDAFGGKKGKRRRSAFSTGNMAGKAQLGIGLLGIAMAAYEHYTQKNNASSGPAPGAYAPMPPTPARAATPPPPPPGASAPPVTTRALPLMDERQQSIVLLIRTMVAAANADGHIDATEREQILGRARDAGLDGETLGFLEGEIAKPQSLQQVIANAKPELASDTYAAAALAITVDTDAERRWLDALALGIGLDDKVRADIDARIAAA